MTRRTMLAALDSRQLSLGDLEQELIGDCLVRISAILDARFGLIADGVSA